MPDGSRYPMDAVPAASWNEQATHSIETRLSGLALLLPSEYMAFLHQPAVKNRLILTSVHNPVLKESGTSSSEATIDVAYQLFTIQDEIQATEAQLLQTDPDNTCVPRYAFSFITSDLGKIGDQFDLNNPITQLYLGPRIKNGDRLHLTLEQAAQKKALPVEYFIDKLKLAPQEITMQQAYSMVHIVEADRFMSRLPDVPDVAKRSLLHHFSSGVIPESVDVQEMIANDRYLCEVAFSESLDKYTGYNKRSDITDPSQCRTATYNRIDGDLHQYVANDPELNTSIPEPAREKYLSYVNGWLGFIENFHQVLFP